MRQTLWKVTNDPATNSFAAMPTVAPKGLALPKAFAVSIRAAPYAVIGMEELEPLQAHLAWTNWVDNDLIRRRGAPV